MMKNIIRYILGGCRKIKTCTIKVSYALFDEETNGYPMIFYGYDDETSEVIFEKPYLVRDYSSFKFITLSIVDSLKRLNGYTGVKILT